MWSDYNDEGHEVQMGTYTTEGLVAITDALRVNASLTQVLVFPPRLARGQLC